ncbi:PadR family transcriptional regulator [Nocardioides soli]|uniref:PadR family transcriptional regulator PadR n=1 Tax=Nocardioides soli TaxID=1036020 RepID=A0A7W4VX80_9ACTN|nr:PadR family transcriptional regulator [Nocardioides soli]MBB3043461.1 PadR family transcriptional regulator PadR [Nocardioides soli]
MVVDEVVAQRDGHLVRGVLEMCVLATLAAAPTHAYDVVDRLRSRGFGSIGYGTVYPLVTRLRKQGLVVQESEPSPAGPPRKVLRVTTAGEAALRDWRDRWAATSAAAERVLAELDGTP